MYKTAALISTLALSALLTGCASGPNTEAGAVTGGAIGMIAGAIIGHDSGNAANGAILGGVAGAVAGGAIGNNVDHERGTVYGSERSVMANPDSRGYRVARGQQVVVGAPPAPPPTPAETVPPQPTPNAVWATGYWVYDGRTYTWMPSHWETPPPGANSYVAGHYENRNGQNVYVPGYWQ